ncbi:outer membrane beta-barrel protein [Botryobacter ruber]|uniref:outer membrane beta-barrel protein n=1 Tax=Botryobacter ruber TaxID=2171629 RepID=UPI000E0AB16D|nr:outer membrane beta-barrel protein [Botryobacter ruber]
MSSADKLERGRLEEEFRSRMHDAEVAPAPDLWSRIEHELTVNENREYKDRLFIYKRLAAACFVLFMLAGALLTFEYKKELAAPATTATAPANNPTTGLAAAEKAADQPTEATGVAANETTGAASINTAPAAPQPKQRTAEAVVAGADQALAAKKAPAAGDVPVNAGELLKLLTNNEGQGNTIAATTPAAVQEDETPVPGATAGIAADSDKAAADKLAVQQMLRNAGSIVALSKEQKKLKDSFAAATTVSSNNDSQAEALTKSFASLNQSDKKAGQTAAGGDSRLSLGMAYGPAYFNQNIGLPNQMMSTVSRNSLVAPGPSTSRFAAENMEAAREEFEDNTDAAFSYAVEARTGIRLGKKWKLLTGIGYSRNSARTKTTYVIRQYWFRPGTREPYELASTIFLPSLNNGFTTDSISVEQTDPFYVNYDYKQLSVPLGLQYESKIAKDWYWYASGGVAANFNLGSEIKATSAEIGSVKYSSRDEDSPFREVQFSGNVGAGIGKRVSESVMVVIGPEFRRYFSTMLARPDEALAPQGKPYSFGVNMGIQYTLDKK